MCLNIMLTRAQLLLCEVFLLVDCNLPVHFTHDFAIELEADHMADFLAQKHDFENLGLVLPGIYHFRHKRIARRSVESFETEAIRNEPGVKSFEQQTVRRRSKRDYSDVLPEGKHPADPLFEDMWYLDPNFKESSKLISILISILVSKIKRSSIMHKVKDYNL